MFMFMFEQPRVLLRCTKDNFKYWHLFSATTILDIADTRTCHIHLVGLYICLLELQYLNPGFLSPALGKEPLEKDWLQGWIKPVDQKTQVFSVIKLGPAWTTKHQAALESKKKNFARVRILLKQTNLHTFCKICNVFDNILHEITSHSVTLAKVSF